MENLVDQFAPFKIQHLIQKNNLCWKCPEASKLIKLKKAALLDFVNSGFDINSAAWGNYRIVGNQANNAVVMPRTRAMNAVMHDDSLDPCQKIKILQGKNQRCNNFNYELDYLDSKFTVSFEMAINLNNHISNIGVKLNEEAKFMKNCNGWTTAKKRVPLNFDKFTLQEISNWEVSQYLNSLKSRKRGGINQIPAFINKILKHLILNLLTHVMNLSLKVNGFPDIWKKALVIPMHKSGQPTLPNNYRPISLLPILSKVLENIINHKIREYLECNQ